MATANPIGYLCDEKGRKLTHEEVARVCNATPVEVSKFLAEILDKGRRKRRPHRADIQQADGKRGEHRREKATKWQTWRCCYPVEMAGTFGVPKQMPGKCHSRTNRPLPIRKKVKLLPFTGAARARATTVENSCQIEPSGVPDNPAVGPATALPTGAPSRPPGTENGEAKKASKRTGAEGSGSASYRPSGVSSADGKQTRIKTQQGHA